MVQIYHRFLTSTHIIKELSTMQLRLFLYLCILCISGDMLSMQENQYHIAIAQGATLTELIPFIAHQRLTVFKEYPYLYQGNFDGEYTYLSWFAQLPYSAVAVAYDGENPIGFLTGTACTDFERHFQGSMTLFQNAGLNPESYYYFSEVIVLPMYRNKSICRRLLEVLEQYACQQGFSAGCLTCEHHKYHPLKPIDYRELDPLFGKLGYKKTELTLLFDWDTMQIDGSIVKGSHP